MELRPKIKAWQLIPLIVSVILAIALLLFLNRAGTLSISSEDGADIFVATSQGGEFKKIGTSHAEYKTRELPSDVYIMSTKGDRKTISGATIKKRGSNDTLNVTLANTVNASKISDGAVFNTFIEGPLVQGIIPEEYMLTSFRTDSFATTRPDFANLPFVKKVVWYDKDNFVYSSLRDGVGRFVNGVDLGRAGFASNSDRESNSIESDDGVSLIEFTDISKQTGRPLIILSDSSIFSSEDMGTTVQKIIDYKKHDGMNIIYTTKDYVFRFSGDEPSAYADEEGKPVNKPAEHTSFLYQYTYQGKEVRKISVDAESVVGVASVGEKIFVATPYQLVSANQTKESIVPLYFSYVRDLTNYKDSVVLLADDGLWKVGEDGTSMQLLYPFTGKGVGLGKSFSVTTSGQLLFGTQAKPGDTSTDSVMFSVTF
jgi:hypothetical protein